MFTCARIQGYPTLPLQFFFSSFSHIDCTLYCKLAWEPRVVIVSPTIYPRFDINYDFSYFFPFKENPLNLESQNHFRGSSEFPNQNLGKSFQGFPSYDRTDKQTDTHIDLSSSFFFSILFVSEFSLKEKRITFFFSSRYNLFDLKWCIYNMFLITECYKYIIRLYDFHMIHA